MAVKREFVSGEGWISDDSSFYGDHDSENDSNDDDYITTYWKTHGELPATIAAKNKKPPAPAPAPTVQKECDVKEEEKLFNPFEGDPSGRQLSETVTEFLKRLPPHGNLEQAIGPWIWIANSHVKEGRNQDLATLGREGHALLQEYTAHRRQVEQENPGKVKGVITRKIGPQREQLKKDIADLAVRTKVTTGKWMLFPHAEEDLPRIWRLVAEGTAEGHLGPTAKVATSSDEPVRLICVYTKDFTDKEDVERVLRALKACGAMEESRRGIYYKSDAYTHLGITRDNEFGLPASLYSSRDFLGKS